MSIDEVVIRPIGQQHLAAVARVHSAAFKGSALTALGAEAIRRYYAWQLMGPHESIAIAAVRDEQLLGFCFAGVFRGALSGFLQKNQGYLAWRAILRPWVLTNTVVRDQLKKRLGLARSRRTPAGTARDANPPPLPSFGVLAIAVDPVSQGNGVGRRLLARVENVALQRGFQRMHLTVDVANHQAVSFYERLEWSRVQNDSAWEGRMQKVLAAVSSLPSPDRTAA